MLINFLGLRKFAGAEMSFFGCGFAALGLRGHIPLRT
jgi:hypothetical protein